jgi:hypothetical protein
LNTRAKRVIGSVLAGSRGRALGVLGEGDDLLIVR